MDDILIRGMEMPDGCHHCRFSYLDKGETNDGEPCSVIMCSAMEQGTNGAEYDGNRPSWCPLVPLPEGHGDLIDRDALRAENGLNAKCEHCPTNTYECQRDMIHTKMEFCEMLDDSPVIVPAEGGTDDV